MLALFILPAASQAQNHLEDARSRFARENDPVHKARLMQQLGQAEFEQMDADFSAGKYPDALAILKDYRDNVAVCEKALDARKIDAEKHPNGFKQLQISTREALRQIDGLLPNLALDDQKPFLAVRHDIDNLNTHLLNELFPGPAPASTKPG